MTKKRFSVSDVLNVQLLGNGSTLDPMDVMRVQMFTLACEQVSEKIFFNNSKEDWISSFNLDIIETSGYRSFSSFCHIDDEGIQDIAERVYNVVELNQKREVY